METDVGEAARREQSELLQGTLDVMVLKVLAYEPTHGWGVSQRLREWSDGVFEVQQGSVYPALQRLKRRGWVRAEWRRTENNRRARYYELTTEGRRRLATEIAEWERASAAVDRVLRFAWQAG